jgi:hypothetical protein
MRPLRYIPAMLRMIDVHERQVSLLNLDNAAVSPVEAA